MGTKSETTTARRLTTRNKKRAPLFAAAGLIETVTPEQVAEKRQRCADDVDARLRKMAQSEAETLARRLADLAILTTDEEFAAIERELERQNDGRRPFSCVVEATWKFAKQYGTPEAIAHRAFWDQLNAQVASNVQAIMSHQQASLF